MLFFVPVLLVQQHLSAIAAHKQLLSMYLNKNLIVLAFCVHFANKVNKVNSFNAKMLQCLSNKENVNRISQDISLGTYCDNVACTASHKGHAKHLCVIQHKHLSL